MFVLNKSNSIANHFLAQIRDINVQGDRMRFRTNLIRLGEIMAYEISKSFAYRSEVITTPLANSNVFIMETPPVLVTILRAGIPFYEGFLNYFDQSNSGFIGAYRTNEGEENDIEIAMEYLAIPEINDQFVILIDPMLATGKSAAGTIRLLEKKGRPRHICICSVIAAPEGLKYLERNVSTDYSIWTVSVDEHLNNKAYIVPGLGDAGDLAFGPKH